MTVYNKQMEVRSIVRPIINKRSKKSEIISLVRIVKLQVVENKWAAQLLKYRK